MKYVIRIRYWYLTWWYNRLLGSERYVCIIFTVCVQQYTTRPLCFKRCKCPYFFPSNSPKHPFLPTHWITSHVYAYQPSCTVADNCFLRLTVSHNLLDHIVTSISIRVILHQINLPWSNQAGCINFHLGQIDLERLTAVSKRLEFINLTHQFHHSLNSLAPGRF